MIGTVNSISTGSGGAVEAHVGNAETNERVVQLYGDLSAVHDMDAMAAAVGGSRSMVHFTASPKGPMTQEKFMRIGHIIDEVFGSAIMQDPLTSITGHYKERADGDPAGKAHIHIITPMIQPDGRCFDLGHSYAKMERVCRILEFEFGHDLILGRHNRAVMHAEKDTRPELVAAMAKAGMNTADLAQSAISPGQRRQLERQGLSVGELKLAMADAWRMGDSFDASVAALHEAGFEIRRGNKHPQVYLNGIRITALYRAIKVNAADINSRLKGYHYGQQTAHSDRAQSREEMGQRRGRDRGRKDAHGVGLAGDGRKPIHAHDSRTVPVNGVEGGRVRFDGTGDAAGASGGRPDVATSGVAQRDRLPSGSNPLCCRQGRGATLLRAAVMSQGRDYINEYGFVCKGEIHFDVEAYKAYLNKLLGLDEDRQHNLEQLSELILGPSL